MALLPLVATMLGKGYVPIDGDVLHFEAAGIYFKRMVLKPGHKVFQHAHKADHALLLTVGKVEVSYDCGTTESYTTRRTAPNAIDIPAGVRHEIKPLTDSVEAWCIWDVRRLGLEGKSSDEIDKALIMD
jgi:quercetin dioxygenase-like cupin family protein